MIDSNPAMNLAKAMNDLFPTPTPWPWRMPPAPAQPTLEEAAGDAAEAIDLDWYDEDIPDPSDRMGSTERLPELPAEATLDITDRIQREMDEWGGGSFVHTDDVSGKDARIMVSEPDVYVTDADGKLIPGAKIIVRYSKVEMETV